MRNFVWSSLIGEFYKYPLLPSTPLPRLRKRYAEWGDISGKVYFGKFLCSGTGRTQQVWITGKVGRDRLGVR